MPSAPDPNPGIVASAQASEKVGMEQIALAREQFKWAQERDAADRAALQPVIDQQMRLADLGERRAQDYFDYEKNTFRPLEQKIIDTANNYNTDAERERQAGLATADISQQFGQAKDQTARALARFGVARDPSQLAAAQSSLDMNEGLAKAGAATKARFGAQQLGNAMMMDAAGLGRGLAPNATAAAGSAIAAGNSASNTTMGLTGSANATRDSARGWYAGGQNSLNGASSGYMNDFNSRMAGYNSQMGFYGDLIKTGAKLYGGGFKDGGEIDGPGSERSDSIPAHLSDGEFVIPAPVVRELGVKFFDNLIMKHGSTQNKHALVRRKAGLSVG